MENIMQIAWGKSQRLQRVWGKKRHEGGMGELFGEVLMCFQKPDELCGLFCSTCRDLETNTFLRIHAVLELYQRDRY